MTNRELPLDGDIVAGRQIIRQVGEGGMGVVFEARDGKGTPQALKVLKPEVAANDSAIREFREEARATAAVDHECVVKVHECGVEGGLHYLAMEFVDGPPLHRLLEVKNRLPWKIAVRIAIQVATALGHAHALDFVHRDVKPGNILLYRDGRARLTDFGIVKDIGSLKGFLVAGRSVGTAAYASPEQCLGKRTSTATDMYSLGATLYHMVCGRPPFTGESVEILMAKHVKAKPIPATRFVPDLPKPLSHLMGKMIAKRQTDRCPSMENLVENLELILDGRAAIAGLTSSRRAILARRKGTPG